MDPAAPTAGGSPTRIVIDLDHVDPPSGWVRKEEGPRVHFDGWLGLLRNLSEAFEPGPRATSGTEEA